MTLSELKADSEALSRQRDAAISWNGTKLPPTTQSYENHNIWQGQSRGIQKHVKLNIDARNLFKIFFYFPSICFLGDGYICVLLRSWMFLVAS